jgi:hypothetical protein
MVDLTETKKPYLSKTLWTNAVVALFAIVGAWVPQVQEVMSEANVILIFSVINVVLRLVTKSKLELW